MTYSLGIRATRSDKRFTSEAERLRAHRERARRQREQMRADAQLMHELALVWRQRAIKFPKKFGEILPLTDAEIIRREIADVKKELQEPQQKQGS